MCKQQITMRIHSKKTNKILKIINRKKNNYDKLFNYLRLTKQFRYICYNDDLYNKYDDVSLKYTESIDFKIEIKIKKKYNYEKISLRMTILLKIIGIACRINAYTTYFYIYIDNHEEYQDDFIELVILFENILGYIKQINKLKFSNLDMCTVYDCHNNIYNLSCFDKFVKCGKIKKIVKKEEGFVTCGCNCNCDIIECIELIVVEKIYLNKGIVKKIVNVECNLPIHCDGKKSDSENDTDREDNEDYENDKSEKDDKICNIYKCLMNRLKYNDYKINYTQVADD